MAQPIYGNTRMRSENGRRLAIIPQKVGSKLEGAQTNPVLISYLYILQDTNIPRTKIKVLIPCSEKKIST